MPAKKRKISLKTKFVIIFLIFFFSFFSLIKPISAFETPNPTYQFQFEEAIKSEEMNLQSFVNETIKAIMGSAVHFIIGTVFPNITNTESQSFDTKNLKNGGLLSAGFLIMSNIYASPPASGVNYLANIGRDLKIINPVYAQERVSGYQVMEPLRQLWKTFRNIAYILLVIVLIAMGFAIMFRVKISPQAIITIQAALPRIIMALILITFSYAIVGFMFDVMTFLNKIIGEIFRALFADPNLSWAGFRNFLTNIIQGLTLNVFERDYIMGEPIYIYQQAMVAFWVFIVFVNFIFPIAGIIVAFIIAIIVAIALFRCIWVVLKAFTMIIINLIFAPLRILMGVFPGSNAMLDWFKDLAANIAVLPAMLTAFGVSSYLIFTGVGISTSGDFWKGIFAGRPFLPSENLIPISISVILPFAGLGILLIAPKVSEIIQSFITKKPFDYGTAMGQAMGPAIFAGKAGTSGGIQQIYEFGQAGRRKWWPKDTPRGRTAEKVKDFMQGQIGKR